MTKFGEIIRYVSYVSIILILFSTLSPLALAGNGVGADNNAKNEKTLETLQKKNTTQEENQTRNQTENKTLEREQLREESQEKTQLKEQLKTQKSNYQDSKKNFLTIRSQLRSGNYDDEDLEITREYLNASVDYMIAYLEKVKYNLEQANGNGTEARITAIETRINQLQGEKNSIEEAKDLEDFVNATESVRGVWNNVRNRTAVETGQVAGEKIDNFVNNSKVISNKLENEIESLNESGVNTTDLEAKLASYNSLMESARENNEAAKEIYSKENATEEELQNADEYLQNALQEIKEANQILKEIFGALEQYREQDRLEEQNQETAKNNSEEVDDGEDDEENDEDAEDAGTTNSSEETTNS